MPLLRDIRPFMDLPLLTTILKYPTGFDVHLVAAEAGLSVDDALVQLVQSQNQGWFDRKGSYFYLTVTGQIEIEKCRQLETKL